jgi:ribokinase
MRADVLVAGSLHYDVIVHAPRLPVADETLAGASVAYAFGGKGGNQAVACARHGARTAFAGRIGDDEAGRFMRSHLQAAGVDTALLSLDALHATGMSVAIVDGRGDYGAVIVSSANLYLDANAVAIPQGCKLLILQNEISEDANIALARKAHDAGVRVLLNAAPARAIEPSLAGLTDFLLVNRLETRALAGRPVESMDEARAAAAELSGNARTAIVTMGAAGLACFMPGEESFVLPAYRVEQISSHGAGDCFAGAFAARLAQGDALRDALTYASAAAALHVSAEPDKRHAISQHEVRQLMAHQPIR